MRRLLLATAAIAAATTTHASAQPGRTWPGQAGEAVIQDGGSARTGSPGLAPARGSAGDTHSVPDTIVTATRDRRPCRARYQSIAALVLLLTTAETMPRSAAAASTSSANGVGSAVRMASISAAARRTSARF